MSSYAQFVQIVLNEPVLAMHRAAQIIATLHPHSEVAHFLDIVNTNLAKADLAIKTRVDHLNDEECLVLIDTSGDNLSQQATAFSPSNIQFYRALVAEIVRTPQMCISTIEALNLSTRTKTVVSKNVAEGLIADLAKEGWINIRVACYFSPNLYSELEYIIDPTNTRRGNIYIGIRASVELQQILTQEHPNDVIECAICKYLIISSYKSCTSCDVRTHTACFRKVVQRLRNPKCPGCESPISINESPKNKKHRGDDMDLAGSNLEEIEDVEM